MSILSKEKDRRMEFSDLYKKYYNQLYNFCLGRLRNPELARDVAQEAFLRAYENMDKLRSIESFYFWITTIALNLIRNIIVRDISRCVTLDNINYFSNEETDTEEEVMKSLETLALRKAICRLSETARQMVILRYYYFFSEKQIGEAMHIPVGTVKSRLYRIRQTLFNELGEYNQY